MKFTNKKTKKLEPVVEIVYNENLFNSPEIKNDGVSNKESRLAFIPFAESGTTKPKTSITGDIHEGLIPPLPSWYHPIQRKHMKNKMIQNLLHQYNQPFKMDTGEIFKPSDKDIKEYSELLKTCKIERLSQMGHLMKYDLKLDVLDRIKSVNKKEHAVVTIFNDNQTTDTGVINCYDRTFSRNSMTYMVMTERGRYDPEFKMMHFYYFANRTCPIEFVKGKLATDAYDAKLIESTIAMKVIEALAAIDMEKFVKIILILLIIMSLILLVDTFTIMKIAKVVGAKLNG
jgi:hypothetical protein